MLVAGEVGGVDRVDAVAALLVRRGDLVGHRHARPGLVRRALVARPGHDLQLGDRGRALPQGGAQAVRAGVAAADDDDVLPGGADRRLDVVALLHLVGQRQVLHRLVDALELAPGHRQVAGGGGAGGDHHRVEAVAQLAAGDVDARLDPGAEPGALGAHLLDPPVDVPLLHLELGDAVAQQAADAVGALVHDHGVAGPGELLGGGQTGRSGADDGHGLAGQPVRRLRGDAAVVPGLVDDGDLDVLDGHRVLVDAQDAGRLTGRGAQPPGELREVVGRVQPLDGAAPVLPVGQVVPLGDEVPERAAVVAERDAAVHAAPGLLGDDGQEAAFDVDLVPVPDPDIDGSALGELLGRRQEALGVSHGWRPPSSSRWWRTRRVRLARRRPWRRARPCSHGA